MLPRTAAGPLSSRAAAAAPRVNPAQGERRGWSRCPVVPEAARWRSALTSAPQYPGTIGTRTRITEADRHESARLRISRRQRRTLTTRDGSPPPILARTQAR